jgi:alpha-tubulin suppressor-like RCC1 family protein
MRKIYFLVLSLFTVATFAQTYDYTLYNPLSSAIGSATIKHIEIDGSGLIWMTTGSTLTKFDGTTFTNYTSANSGVPMDALGKVVIDNLNRKWIATAQSGLLRFDGTTWTNYTPTNSGIPSLNIQDIAVDSANNIWLATYSGLVKFNGTTWTIYTTSNSTINSNSIISVAVNSSNTVYLTGDSILMKFNGTTFSILGDQANKIRKVVNNDLYVDIASSGYLKYTNETVAEGQYYGNNCMLDCRIEGMDVDQNNKVWMGFTQQCAQGGLQNYTDCKNYYPTIMMASFNNVSCLKMQTSNTIWVGTSDLGLIKMSLHTGAVTCNVPTNLSATNVTASSVTLNWTAPSPAPNGYTFMVNNSPTLGGSPIYTTSTSVTVTNLTPNSDYYWWVAADCGNSQSDWSLAQFFGTQLEPPCFAKISGGSNHTAAVKVDGTLWAWGANNYKQLGDGTTTNRTSPVQIGTATNWKSVAAGQFHTIALKTDGTLWAWGNNGYGQLGDGTTIDKSTPVQIGTATDWLSIAVGDQHSFAIKTNGTLWGWGANGTYQLGDGTNTYKTVPTQLGTATNWKSVAGSPSHSLALKTNGTIWAWGANPDGEIGDNTTTWRSTPVQVGTATDWKYIHTKGGINFAIKNNGTLWGWGYNTDGRLGDGSTTTKRVPTQIRTATDWKSVYTSGGNTLGIKNNNTLWVWGSNTQGELGNGNTNYLSAPTQIGFEVNWVSAGGGDRYSVLLNSDGKVFTCGWSPQGQLGAGTTFTRTTPGQLPCPSPALAIDDFEVANTMKVYPNPVKDVLNISFDTEITLVSIYNILGQEMMSKIINAKEGTIDVSNLRSGTYFVKVSVGNLIKTLKVIKE